jgi:small subunit ribosomal protein S27e
MAGSFLTVECAECEHEQTVFSKAATAVDCADCGHELLTPTGGEAAIDGAVLETVEHR